MVDICPLSFEDPPRQLAASDIIQRRSTHRAAVCGTLLKGLDLSFASYVLSCQETIAFEKNDAAFRCRGPRCP